MRTWFILAGTFLTIMAMTGCATRGSVREVASRVDLHAQQIDTAQTRIEALDQRSTQFGQRLDDLDSRVGQLGRHYHAANVVETMDVHFGFNRADLDDGAMTRLHELAKQLKADGRLGAELVGYTDSTGSVGYNVQLAQRRVDAVRRYLVQQGVPVSRVAAIGLGPTADRHGPSAKKRRVTVQLTMSEAMVMAQSAPSSGDATTSAQQPDRK